jgi:hypothetical protein
MQMTGQIECKRVVKWSAISQFANGGGGWLFLQRLPKEQKPVSILKEARVRLLHYLQAVMNAMLSVLRLIDLNLLLIFDALPAGLRHCRR